MAGWEVLRAEYFIDTASAVLAPLFHDEGLRRVKDRSAREGVNFGNENCSLRFSYWWEDAPDYMVMITVGPPDSSVLAAGPLEEFPLWFVIPEGSPLRKALYGRFRSAEELHDVLSRSFQEKILVYAKPLWSDPTRLAAVARRFAEQSTRPT